MTPWSTFVAAMILCTATHVSATTLAEEAKKSGCFSKPIPVQGTLYRCSTESGAFSYFNVHGLLDAQGTIAEYTDPRTAAFAQVKIGMTHDAVNRIDQVGNECANWPHQRPPVCGPLQERSPKGKTSPPPRKRPTNQLPTNP